MDNICIKANDVSKVYHLYNNSSDRVKELFGTKKRHTDFYALKNVNIEIQKGETVGFVGKNGSGKSTLLKILTEVLTPTEGELIINGTVSALLELGAGFNGELTGIENIYQYGTLQGFSRERMSEKIDDIIAFADIGEYINQPVKTYSSGMFVRLAFSVAISVDPDILIVDEALAVGDTRFQLKCMDKFLEFKSKGVTILYVSHDVNSIKRFCDRAIWLNEGQLIEDGDVDTVTDKYLDYLKSLDSGIKPHKEETVLDKIDPERIDIAEIISLKMFDTKGKEIQDIKHGEKINLELQYYVKDAAIKKPVAGISISRVDNLYICGLNTLLDNIDIPWEKGVNKVYLTYDPFTLVGGSYYFDVALFDQTASVAIDYRSKYKEFFVKMNYIAEGINVIPHKWSV